MTNDIKNLASALILMGALVACGEELQDVEYNIDDNDTSVRMPTLAEREQCYGIALAQYNDCATRTGKHCAGTATLNYQTDRWQYTPRGTCEDKGGSLKPKKDERIK